MKQARVLPRSREGSRSLRGPPHFLLRLSGAESPLYELLTHSVSSPASHAGREATMPHRQRTRSSAQHHLPGTRNHRCASPRPPALARAGAAGSPPATSSSRPTRPRLWAGPERSGFRFPLSCLAVSGNGRGFPPLGCLVASGGLG